MKRIHWHSKGSHHWGTEGRDWMLFTKEPDDGVQQLKLRDGDHHWFNAAWIFLEGEMVMIEKLFEGSGPFTLTFRDDLSPGNCQRLFPQKNEVHVPVDCKILFSLTTVPFKRRPFAPDESLEVSCGLVILDTEEEPVNFHFDNEKKSADRDEPADPREAKRAIEVSSAESFAIPSLIWRDSIRAPFSLKKKNTLDVEVYSVIAHPRGGEGIKAAERISRETLDSNCGHGNYGLERCATIPAGAYSPSASIRGFDGKALLPTIDLGNTIQLGELLLPSDLFKGNDIEIAADNNVYAQLTWPLPAKWLEYKIEWGFDSDDGWLHILYPEVEAGHPQQKTVNYRTYRRDDGIRLFRRVDFLDWTLQLEMTPILFGEPRPDLKRAVRKELKSH